MKPESIQNSQPINNHIPIFLFDKNPTILGIISFVFFKFARFRQNLPMIES